MTLGSFGSGWLLRITTSYVMVLVCIGGLEVGSLIFLIAWERQPSFEVIIIVAAIFGLCYGLNATVGLGKQFTETPCVSLMGREEQIVQLHVISPTHCSLQWYCSWRQCDWILLWSTQGHRLSSTCV